MLTLGNLSETMERIKQYIAFLGGPEAGGRLSGTESARKAADYLAAFLQQTGYSPAGIDGYLTPVEVSAARLTGPAQLTIGEKRLRHRIDFAEMAPFSSGGSVTGTLVTIRDGEEIDSDNLAGKVVLIPERPDRFDLKKTAEAAVVLGVAALLIEFGDPHWFPKTIFGSKNNKIPVIRIRRSLAQEFADQEVQVHLELPLETETMVCNNVYGFLPGAKTDRTLVLTAHYDHLGDDPGGVRFPGAIDNGSGVAVMMEVARSLKQNQRSLPFHVLVAFVTGEESGLWGSRHLAANPPVPLSAVINLDCLGFEPILNAMRVGHKSPGLWLADLAAAVILDHGVEPKWIYGGEDSVAFTEKGIPAVGFGQKPTLSDSIAIHTPNDNPENLHDKPIELGLSIVSELINRLAILESWEPEMERTG
ncbi:M28 family metallopeptidase [Brevibacillus sp. H7]|uniref:M28 family metallopeptidase n=1 Tax=Brevibacillus sp. H7 TaxID=3349138 RepID=UPI00382E246C